MKKIILKNFFGLSGVEVVIKVSSRLSEELQNKKLHLAEKFLIGMIDKQYPLLDYDKPQKSPSN